MTFEGSPSATGSPEPGCGASPREWQDGPTTDLFGQPVAPASRGAGPDSNSVSMIQGICGRTYIESSVPTGEQDTSFLSLWESKLRARLATIGSTESALIWREKKSPLGQSTSRLAVSTRHTNGTDSIGAQWPTPTSLSFKDSHQPGNCASMNCMMDLARGTPMETGMWPSPKSSAAGPDFAKAERSDTGLSTQTVMAGTVYWPTPKASAAGESSRSGDRKDEPLMGSLMRMADKAMWVTPSARDFKDSEGMATEGEQTDGDQIAIPGMEKHRQRTDQLPRQMVAVDSKMWPTPLVSDGRGAGSRNAPGSKAHPGVSLSDVLLTGSSTGRTEAGGPTPNGSSVTTEKRGAPNPEFACWLMGWPAESISGALRAIASFRASRPKSSARSSTRRKK